MKVFQQKCKERFSGDEAEIKALEMCSLWQENVKNSEWHPFKIVTVEGSSEHQVRQMTLMGYKELDTCYHLLFAFICVMSSDLVWHVAEMKLLRTCKSYLILLSSVFYELEVTSEYLPHGRK